MSSDLSTPSSKRSSFSSVDVPAPQFNRSETGASTTSSSTSASASSLSLSDGVVVDVLCRDFPKPIEDINVAEMIARAPQRHSLRYYVKNARDSPLSAQNREQQAIKFAETKRQLLEARETLARLPVTKQ